MNSHSEWLTCSKEEDSLEAMLLLQDGTVIQGRGFGFPCRIIGEVVFNTGMVGYTEAFTDPSYRGQILCSTYPLIGNYGVPSYEMVDEFSLPQHFESNRIQVSGIIIHELCRRPSHPSSVKSLHKWLYDEGIPGISGVDTRSLTMKLRVHGVMMGALEVANEPVDVTALKQSLNAAKTYGKINFVSEVSLKEPKIYGHGDRCVVLLDCGVKLGILRRLLKSGFKVVMVPYDTSANHILSYEPLGVVISNGPGDPKLCLPTIKALRSLVDENTPTLGICLGNQILALALGGDTFKLKYGHRGQNKPCVDITTGRSYVTSQNHGYAVDPSSLGGTGLSEWFINADDKTIEGLKHKKKQCMAVQFHPEASPGPYDTEFIFDIFSSMVKNSI